MNKLKLYVGCALTGASPEFIEKIKVFKQELAPQYEVLEFLWPKPGAPLEVYQRDIQECVAGCDMMIAFCDRPSMGLGYELGTAVEKYSKPVLAVAHKDSKVSRLIMGVDHPMYTFSTYDDIEEVHLFLEQKVQKHFPTIEINTCETDACSV
jgi:hypothetical protein